MSSGNDLHITSKPACSFERAGFFVWSLHQMCRFRGEVMFGIGFSTGLAVSVEKLSEELVKEFVEECDGMADDLLLFARDHMVASLDNNQLRFVSVGLHESLAA